HPYDYKDFEGVIPKGNYGAGTVIVWDEGTYEPLEPAGDKKAMEKDLMSQWRAGSIKVVLKGKKLKGEFALVKMKGKEDNAWLLIKHNDRYATDADITQHEKSVVSKLTLNQVAAAAGNGNTKRSAKGKTRTKRADKAPLKGPVNLAASLEKAKKAPFPKAVPPMLATLIDEPFDDPEWEYEVKWDGYRAVAFRKGKLSALKSRND